jgi:hypothetical protein
LDAVEWNRCVELVDPPGLDTNLLRVNDAALGLDCLVGAVVRAWGTKDTNDGDRKTEAVTATETVGSSRDIEFHFVVVCHLGIGLMGVGHFLGRIGEVEETVVQSLFSVAVTVGLLRVTSQKVLIGVKYLHHFTMNYVDAIEIKVRLSILE